MAAYEPAGSPPARQTSPNHPVQLPAANPLQTNLYRLLLIRALVLLLQLLALAYTRYRLALPLDYPLVLAVLLLLALVNGGLFLRLRLAHHPGQQELFVHLLVDVLGLGLLLYFTGGANNPFVSYLLVPITIAAIALPPAYALGLGGIALLCYSLLLFYFQPLPALMPAETLAHADHLPALAEGSAMPNLHILGMWFNFAVSAALIIFFVVRLAAELRQREQRLARFREETLRNEQIMAVAIQAAGTAHSLGTPLGTMAVLLNDLRRDHAADSELGHDLQTLQNQVALCRDALKGVVSKADFKQARWRRLDLRAFVEELLQHWQLLRPEVPCRSTVQTGPAPKVRVDTTLEQALVNLLNNAAEAGPGGIEIEVRWQQRAWTMQVRDFGAGVPRELQEQLGTTIISGKTAGLGVGLVLSQATFNRLGGSVSLYPQTPRGTLTVIELPLEHEDG